MINFRRLESKHERYHRMAGVIFQDTFHVPEDTLDGSHDTFGWVKCSLERTRNYQWREIPDATRFSKRPGSGAVASALSRLGGAYACGSGQDLLRAYSDDSYVVFKCKCMGSIRIKVACQTSDEEWCLFVNHDGLHSQTFLPTTSTPVLSAVIKHFLATLMAKEPGLSQTDALKRVLKDDIGRFMEQLSSTDRVLLEKQILPRETSQAP
jgi:hypothetical protein